MEHTAPLDRLRTRQLRYPSLATWKVFEIAAILPHLLQLALTLFLVGLCCFTWPISAKVGLMNTILVAIWAFLVSAAATLSVLYETCPYKISLPSWVRKHLRGAIALLLKYAEPYRKDRPPETRERNPAVNENDGDTTLLADIDAFLLDDHLLATSINDAIRQVSDPSIVIRFLLGAIERRLGGALGSSVEYVVDLRKMSRQGWTAVMDAVSNLLVYHLVQRQTPPEPRGWTRSALCILLSLSEFPLPPGAVHALSCAFDVRSRETIVELMVACVWNMSETTAPREEDRVNRFAVLTRALQQLREVFQTLETDNIEYVLRHILSRTICELSRCALGTPDLQHFFTKHAAQWPSVAVAVVQIMTDSVRRELSPSTAWSPTNITFLRALLSPALPPAAQHEVCVLISALLRITGTRSGTLAVLLGVQTDGHSGDGPKSFPAALTRLSEGALSFGESIVCNIYGRDHD